MKCLVSFTRILSIIVKSQGVGGYEQSNLHQCIRLLVIKAMCRKPFSFFSVLVSIIGMGNINAEKEYSSFFTCVNFSSNVNVIKCKKLAQNSLGFDCAQLFHGGGALAYKE